MILIPDLQQRMELFCSGALDGVESCLLLGWLPAQGQMAKCPSRFLSLAIADCAKASSTQKEERKGVVHVRFTPKILADVSLKRPSTMMYDLVGARPRPVFVLCKACCTWFTETSTCDKSGAK